MKLIILGLITLFGYSGFRLTRKADRAFTEDLKIKLKELRKEDSRSIK